LTTLFWLVNFCPPRWHGNRRRNNDARNPGLSCDSYSVSGRVLFGPLSKISAQGASAGFTPAAPLPNRIAYIAGFSQKIKIMPLGDSITFGSPEPGYGGYRHLLGTLLINDGYTIDFVGSRQNNEGHPGWTIPQIKNGIDSRGWLETYQPDIILLHIGTNDIRQGNAASAPADLSALLDDILTRLPQTHVIVAQIVPFRRGPAPAHQSAILGIVASKGPRVSLVDMQNILSPSDYEEGIHPNAGGYDKMAHAWEPAIRAVLSGSAPRADAPPPRTSADEGVKSAVPAATGQGDGAGHPLRGRFDQQSRTTHRGGGQGAASVDSQPNPHAVRYSRYGPRLFLRARRTRVFPVRRYRRPFGPGARHHRDDGRDRSGARRSFGFPNDQRGATTWPSSPPGIPMGAFEVPVTGISLGGQMYVAVSTNHSADRTTDRSVLTKFTPPAKFQPLRTISQLPEGHFVKMSVHTEPGPIAGLPPGGPFLILWGQARIAKVTPISPSSR
jgi:lysophospholipase L1-like esterase